MGGGAGAAGGWCAGRSGAGWPPRCRTPSGMQQGAHPGPLALLPRRRAAELPECAGEAQCPAAQHTEWDCSGTAPGQAGGLQVRPRLRQFSLVCYSFSATRDQSTTCAGAHRESRMTWNRLGVRLERPLGKAGKVGSQRRRPWLEWVKDPTQPIGGLGPAPCSSPPAAAAPLGPCPRRDPGGTASRHR